MKDKTPAQIRQSIRLGQRTGPTAGLCGGYVQGNLVVLPREYAYDFLLFCQRNPRSCPLLEVSDPGSREFPRYAPGCDIARDIPRYRVYRDGQLVEEPTGVDSLWRADLVSFLIGCSFSFEDLLIERGIEMRHIALGRNVPMYNTSIPCQGAGRFQGNMVVSMRPIPGNKVADAVQATGRMPMVHGAPLQVGDPAAIGIAEITRPDYGDAVPIHAGELPVFWACGVTPQAAAAAAKLPLLIAHAPGHMLVTDIRNSDLCGG